MCPVWLTLPSAWTLFKSGSAPVTLSLSERSAYRHQSGHESPLPAIHLLLIIVSVLTTKHLLAEVSCLAPHNWKHYCIL